MLNNVKIPRKQLTYGQQEQSRIHRLECDCKHQRKRCLNPELERLNEKQTQLLNDCLELKAYLITIPIDYFLKLILTSKIISL